MRDLSGGPELLSINGATVRKQADLSGIVEACARHGIAAISPWRDQVEALGIGRAQRAIRDAGLKLSGYCRAGLFPFRIKASSRARSSALSRTTYIFTDFSRVTIVPSVARIATEANHQILSNWLKRATRF